jgi:uncharacterized protein (TIGR03435 family)
MLVSVQLCRDLAAVLGSLCLLATPSSAQGPQGSDDATLPRFDVASVKPNDSSSGAAQSGNLPDGGYRGTNVTLRRLLIDAYGVQANQIVDAPDWLNSARFDVNARAASQDDQTPARLRALLADRFQLIAHTEKRPRPVYALELSRPDGKLGPGLKPSTADCSFAAVDHQPKRTGCGVRGSTGNWGGSLGGTGKTLSEIADALGDHGADRPVVDKTGRSGQYDFELRWSNNPSPDTDEVSLVTALREQLGLALVADTAPVDVLVIDHIEKPDPD